MVLCVYPNECEMDEIKSIPFRKSLQAKLLITVSLVILVICTTAYLVIPYLMELIIIDASLANTRGITDIASSSISSGLYFEDNESVTNTMQNVLVYDEARRIALYDFNKKKFAELRKTSYNGKKENILIENNNTVKLDGYIVSSKGVYHNDTLIGYLVVYTTLENIYASITQFRNAILLFSLCVFGLGNLAIILGFRPIVGRIKTMMKVVEKITLGKYTERVTVSGQDEIRYLADSFNRMVDSVVQAYNNIAYTNSNLEYIVEQRTSALNEEISVRKVTEKELLFARDKAEEANRTKSAFLASMSHELRTPLNSIIGFSQILREDKNIDVQNRVYVEMMYKSGSHLLDLINEILDISKIEAGQLELHEENSYLADIIESVRLILMTKASEKNLLLIVRADQQCPISILTDARRLKQVLINLVGNAVKFTKHGQVQLLVDFISKNSEDSSTQLKFTVKDTGPGIPDHQIERIFQPFKQQATHYSEGTGLGLAISARIIEKMGGKITVTSEIGVGSEFSFILSIKTIDFGNEHSRNNNEKRIKSVIHKSPPPKILVVDDVEANRLLLTSLLEMIGFDCYEAENGRDAIQKALAVHPQIIFMDLMMPEMTGKEAIKKLNEYEELLTIPVIAVTADVLTESEEDLLRLGFKEVINKPFRIEQIHEVLLRSYSCDYIFEDDTIEDASRVSENDLNAGQIAQHLQILPNNLLRELNEAIVLQELDVITEIIKSNFPDNLEIQKSFSRVIKAAETYDYKFFIKLSDEMNPD